MKHYNILKAKAGLPLDNHYEMLFGKQLAVKPIKTLTGTPPLVFRTSETSLRSWTIYGNNTPHIASSTSVLPLTFTTTEDKLRDWEIFGNDDIHDGQQGVGQRTENLLSITADMINANNWITAHPYNFFTYYKLGDTTTARLKEIGTISGTVFQTGTYYGGEVFAITSEQLPSNVTNDMRLLQNDGTPLDWTKDVSAWENIYLCIGLGSGIYENNKQPLIDALFDNFDISIVRGSTAPSTYVPYGYEIPISCEHSMVGAIKIGYYSATGFNGSATNRATTEPKYLATGTYKVNIPSFVEQALIKCIADEKEATAAFVQGSTVTISTAGDYTIQINITNALTQAQLAELDSAMLLSDGTDYTFYIDSPLTAGQSISKTSTGVDIDTQVGENTISTSLYNKPETAISFVDFVGVGEKSGNNWQIPITVSDGTNTQNVNIPIDAPLTDGQSVTDTTTIPTYTGENTVDTTLTNKPSVEIKYK